MSDHEARVRRILAADRETVWRHLVEPALLEQWCCPNPQLSLAVEFDPRVGGPCRIDMGGDYVATGECTEVADGERLAYTWSWQHEPEPVTLVTILLADADDGTALELVQSGFPDAEEAAGHREGWELSLDRLATLVG